MSNSGFNQDKTADKNLGLDLDDIDTGIEKKDAKEELLVVLKNTFLSLHKELQAYINTQMPPSSSLFKNYTQQGSYAKKISQQLDNVRVKLAEEFNEGKTQITQDSLQQKIKDSITDLLKNAINTAQSYETGKREPLIKALQNCQSKAGLTVTVPEAVPVSKTARTAEGKGS